MFKNSVFEVDGKPFFPLGAQAHNSSGYSLIELEDLWKSCELVGANSCAIAVSWERFESVEGVFDESIVEDIILACRSRNLKLMLLWFGTWKNGHMKYVPQWVKSDRSRFPRVLTHDGYEIANLSSFSLNTLNADKKAFEKLMEIIKKVDSAHKTVLTVQVQNELGIVGRSIRDYGEVAQQQYLLPVPQNIILKMKMDHSAQEFITKIWLECGKKENHNWFDTFGRHGDEFLQAYSMANYIDTIALAGKQVYQLPMYTNVWQDNQGFDIPGINYPSGGAVSKNLAIWRWFSPNLDMICPDIYVQTESGYQSVANSYTRDDNALYIPETGWGVASSLWVFRAIAEHGLTGVHFFGAENILAKDGTIIPEAEYIHENFQALSAVTSLLSKYRNEKCIYAVVQKEFAQSQEFIFDGYKGIVTFTPFPRSGDYQHIGQTQSRGRGLIIQIAPNTFIACGAGFSLKLRHNPHIAQSLVPQQQYQEEHFMNYISVEEGIVDLDGNWQTTRIRNGDETDFGVFVYPDYGAVKIIVD